MYIGEPLSAPTPALSVAGMAGWPACPKLCTGHGRCTHIGVCDCHRGWGGDDCSKPYCPAACAGHGRCLLSTTSASCVCDEGYVGFDCATLAQPPSLPPNPVASPAPPPPPASSLFSDTALRFNVTSRSSLWLPSGRGRPLSTTLPPGAQSLYWGADGAPPQALRILAGPAESGDDALEATLPMAESVEAAGSTSPTALKKASSHILGALQASSGPSVGVYTAGLGATRRVVASVVDWRTSRAYVALSSRSGGACCPILQLSLPSMAVLHAESPKSVQPDAYTSCLALGGDASETAAPASWLYVLRSTHEGKRTELLSLSLPSMQPTHSLSFDTPGAVTAAHYDVRSAYLYLLSSAAPAPRLVRIQMHGGAPAGPPGRGDSLPLPAWEAAATLFVPFPHTRQLVFFSAPGTIPPPLPSYLAPAPLQVCRVRLGAAASLGSDPATCTALRGQYASEQVTSAVADEAAGVAYLGCRSGRLLRLRISPLRVEESLSALTASSVASLAFRPIDGSLWLAAEGGGELLRLTTRMPLSQPPSPSPPPAWFRWSGAPASARAGTRPLQVERTPPSPPPLLAPPRLISNAYDGSALASAVPPRRVVWIYPRLGVFPAMFLVLLGLLVGSVIGSRLYRLWRVCFPGKREGAGLVALP